MRTRVLLQYSERQLARKYNLRGNGSQITLSLKSHKQILEVAY